VPARTKCEALHLFKLCCGALHCRHPLGLKEGSSSLLASLQAHAQHIGCIYTVNDALHGPYMCLLLHFEALNNGCVVATSLQPCITTSLPAHAMTLVCASSAVLGDH